MKKLFLAISFVSLFAGCATQNCNGDYECIQRRQEAVRFLLQQHQIQQTQQQNFYNQQMQQIQQNQFLMQQQRPLYTTCNNFGNTVQCTTR